MKNINLIFNKLLFPLVLTLQILWSHSRYIKKSIVLLFIIFPIYTFAAAEDDSFTTSYNTVITENVLTNDTGTDKYVESYTLPTCGTIDIFYSNGQFTYDPGTCTGNITFTYTMQYFVRRGPWGRYVTDTATVTITIENSGGGGTTPVDENQCSTGTTTDYREFCLRKKITAPGNIVTIGNTILVAPDTGNGASTNVNVCSTYTNGTFISDATSTNNDYYLCEYYADGTNPSTSATVSSGTSTSHIPDPTNSTLRWAGLYWQALVDDSENMTGMQIRIKNGNDAYVTIGYDNLDYGRKYGNGEYNYAAFKDVTSILQDNNWLTGEFTVADIPIYEGKYGGLGTYGAWTLVLVYENTNEKLRNFTIFDGWQVIDGNNDTNIGISGFYTSKQRPISSSASIFVAEGDKRITGDKLFAKPSLKTNETQLTYDTSGDKQAVWSAIKPDYTRTPNPINNQGIDIQTFHLGSENQGYDILEPQESAINFRFTTDGDVYWPSMIAFNSELYAPKLCYDYAYSQNGIYFTEDNNGSIDPRIIGSGLNTSEDIKVEIFIRNDEESDTDATDMVVHITDVNATQATYVDNSTYVTLPGQVTPQLASGSPLQNIEIGTVGGKEYFYIDYLLDPLTSSINMPLTITLEYTLTLSDASGNPVNIDYNTTINNGIPLCTTNNFAYYPNYDIFNVENSILGSNPNAPLYNLPTQTANRVGDFKVTSYQPSPNYHVRNAVMTTVAVELIDANKYHDIKASCTEPDSALTPRIWVTLGNQDGNQSQVEFDQAVIQNAINNNLVSDSILNQANPIGQAEDYFAFVRENTAFRLTYNQVGEGELIQLTPGTCQGQQVAPCFEVQNFPDFGTLDIGAGIGNCVQDIDGNPNSRDKIPQYCGNAGARGLDSVELAQCMECI
ncbi:MAG TPA: hypothetical protein EYH57_04960, partial [Sulfurovum sp.]|nr:hypothetical protein [Sulfurovum sp.]